MILVTMVSMCAQRPRQPGLPTGSACKVDSMARSWRSLRGTDIGQAADVWRASAAAFLERCGQVGRLLREGRQAITAATPPDR